ncbi:MAG: VOC family protein [Bacteroidetes bacterium]|nr:VOC family protein [Bacteroidota bacterium]
MRNTTPYLHFKGNAEQAINFYKSVLGGEFLIFQRYKDVPGGEKMSSQDQEKLIHVSLQVSLSITIMASDTMQSAEQDLVAGNNFHICLHTESEAETERLFEGLSKNGHVEMPLNKTFWGAYFGMCQDKFGIHWMLSYSVDQK